MNQPIPLQRLGSGQAAGVEAPFEMLAVSGGGDNGAFGAGLLNGWTAHGSRPVFELVTGISTGALTAPFAFLGSSWDAPLREVYTQVTLEDVARTRGVFLRPIGDTIILMPPLSVTEEEIVAIADAIEYGITTVCGRG